MRACEPLIRGSRAGQTLRANPWPSNTSSRGCRQTLSRCHTTLCPPELQASILPLLGKFSQSNASAAGTKSAMSATLLSILAVCLMLRGRALE